MVYTLIATEYLHKYPPSYHIKLLCKVEKKCIRFLLGTGQMPHMVGGVIGVNLSRSYKQVTDRRDRELISW